MILAPVTPYPGDDQTFEGQSDEVGVFVGGSDQYAVNMNIRKSIMSVGSAGKVVTYVTIVQITKLSTSTVYAARLQNQDQLKLDAPILLATDRYTPNERYFTENIFQISLE